MTTVCPNCAGDLDSRQVCRRCGGRWTSNGQAYVAPDWVLCPFCGQDWAKPRTVLSTAQAVWVCAECDSVWPSAAAVPREEPRGLRELVPDEWQDLGDVVDDDA